jgi:hypothetical protein
MIKRLLLIAFLCFAGWKSYETFQTPRFAHAEAGQASDKASDQDSIPAPPATSKFTCDGRTHCSHMTSCEEATFFLRNCPGTKMDGNNDGIPCEKQWCR